MVQGTLIGIPFTKKTGVPTQDIQIKRIDKL